MPEMTKQQALRWAAEHGCRFLVYNDYGGLEGGFTTRKEAEKFMDGRADFYKDNPWVKGDIKFWIKEIGEA